MESERFSVPELLFRPTDIGLAQAGVTESTSQMLDRLHDVSADAVCMIVSCRPFLYVALTYYYVYLDGDWFVCATCYFDRRECLHAALQKQIRKRS